MAIKARAIHVALLLGLVGAVGTSAFTPQALMAAPTAPAVASKTIAKAPQNNGMLNTIMNHNITVHIVAVFNYKEPKASSTELW